MPSDIPVSGQAKCKIGRFSPLCNYKSAKLDAGGMVLPLCNYKPEETLHLALKPIQTTESLRLYRHNASLLPIL